MVVENAPWVGGNSLTHKVLDTLRLPTLPFHNKRDNRPGERII